LAGATKGTKKILFFVPFCFAASGGRPAKAFALRLHGEVDARSRKT
jgi:hypothetical protein